jgi:hypothetical protein
MAAALVALLVVGTVPAAMAQDAAGAAEEAGLTPPRLSYVEGPVSFWRPGADDWAPAQLNTPLAAGDEFYTAHEGNVELQVGPRAFVRGWGDTQLGLANHEPDHLQVKATTGHVALDLRELEPGRTVELDTPHAAVIVDTPGYYRADVTADRTSLVVRRGGRATVTALDGTPVVVGPDEAVVAQAAPAPAVQRVAAAADDVWDRWNAARTDALVGAASTRYVPADVYGASELDRYGAWRSVTTYGSVWVPAAVPVGWAPYTSGRWIWDPVYGWTWVDTAPWGWAPFHYGRWVFLDGYWAWAPGPRVRRAVYAPALVVFFGSPGVRVGVGAPLVSWCALGWGEPVLPWWGRHGFVGRPWWGGWAGPRHTTVVNVTNVTVYRNVRVRNAVVAVDAERFGRRPVHEGRVRQVDVGKLSPVRGQLDVRPAPASFVAGSGRAARPSEATLTRPVVATRQLARRERTPAASASQDAVRVETPPARVVPAPARSSRDAGRPAAPTVRPDTARPDGARGSDARRPEESRQPTAPRTPDVGREAPREPMAPRDQRATPREPGTAPSGITGPAGPAGPRATPRAPAVPREPTTPRGQAGKDTLPTAPGARGETNPPAGSRPAPGVRPDTPPAVPDVRREPPARPEPDTQRPGEPRREPDGRPRSDARPASPPRPATATVPSGSVLPAPRDLERALEPGRQPLATPAARTPERAQPPAAPAVPAARTPERAPAVRIPERSAPLAVPAAPTPERAPMPARPQALPAARAPESPRIPARTQPSAPGVRAPERMPAPTRPPAPPAVSQQQTAPAPPAVQRPAPRPQPAAPATHRAPPRNGDRDARPGPRG